MWKIKTAFLTRYRRTFTRLHLLAISSRSDCGSLIFRAQHLVETDGILAWDRSQTRRSSVAGPRNRRINTILLLLLLFLLFCVRWANWARWICAPSHAVTYGTRVHADARTHARTHTDGGARTCVAISRTRAENANLQPTADPLAIDERRRARVPRPPNKLIRVIGKLTD